MTLKLESVTLELGDGDETVTALDHVSMDVADGEIVAVVGQSGSGKSSLLAVSGSLITPGSGRVTVDGIDVGDADEKARSKLRSDHVGFVFQSVNLLPSHTSLDQLLLICHIAGDKQGDERDKAMGLLEEVGVAHKADRRPHELSGGERQRVGIARALMCEPGLLLVDEPTSALHHQRGEEIARLLTEETRRRSVATIMVTHDRSITRWADRVLAMQDGRILDDTPSPTAREPAPPPRATPQANSGGA